VQQIRLHAGDAVRIRDERWRVAAESSFGQISIVDVDGCDATNRGIKARFLVPFERVDPEGASSALPRMVTPQRWRRAARALLVDAVPQWSSLRAAARSNLAVLPFQLEPAIAIAHGDTCRVLIADEVGLGKTIQAGLIVAESLVRTPEARVLIVAPAGLRDQWRDELNSRFQLRAEVLDAQGIARTAAELIPGVNPWSIHPVAITSIDYIKRAEVMRSLETLIWDVVVFDEAHALAGRSDRATAAAALAIRARLVVMLTATPHSGDEEAFARLCGLGDIRNAFPLTIFHRSRSDVGLPHNRRSSLLKVRTTTEEAAMHRALEDYIQRITEETGTDDAGTSLLGSILLRRACSSASSLARSVERRMALLLDDAAPSREQLTLPFIDSGSDDEPGWELGVAGLRDAQQEQQWLRRLAEIARAAAIGESKIRALQRLLRRLREPAIIFTEYRDTLQHVSAALAAFAPLVLHGGLTTRERGEVIRQFTEQQKAVLLATDAASEGLNLHHRCRFVVNLEVPWTPLRLEQRVGRVDRLGQPRRVHALNLIATGTHDAVMVGRLHARTDRIAAAFSRSSHERRLHEEADIEAKRLLTARALSPTVAPPPPTRAFITSVRTASRAAASITAFRVSFVDENGQSTFETITGVLNSTDQFDLRADVAATHHHHEKSLAHVAAAVRPWLELAVQREQAIAGALRDSHARLSVALLQPGLFDRRAERAVAAQAARVDEALDKSRSRLDAFERLRKLRCGDRRVLFGIRFCS
jgi:superfamily II DNA or RNA helicase